MKYLVLLLALLLVGCTSADPYQRIQSAQAEIAATQRAEIRQRQEQNEQERRATQSAMETQEAAQAEIDLMNARAMGTQTALELQIGQIEAAGLSAQATQKAWEYGMAVQGTQQAGEATATALVIEMENARQTAAHADQVAKLWYWGGLSVLAIVMAGLMVGMIIGLWYLWKWLDWKIAWTDRKNLIYNSPDGTIFVDYSTGQPKAMLVREIDYYRSRKRLDAPKGDAQTIQDVQWTTPSVASSPMPQPAPLPDDLDAALEVVEASIEHFGDSNATKIPRYNVINMTPTRWELGTDFLVSQGLIEKSQGKPTVTRMKLRDILYRLQHSPTPG